MGKMFEKAKNGSKRGIFVVRERKTSGKRKKKLFGGKRENEPSKEPKSRMAPVFLKKSVDSRPVYKV
ncbi:MAG: hypothetical protein ACLUUJ_05015 [Acutalibacteraceae bacterium]